MSKFEEGLKLDVKNILRKKQNHEYLPWASAMGEFFKLYPEGDFELIENERGTYEFGDSQMGYVVKTRVWKNEEGETRPIPCTLPVKDNRNNSILKPTSMQVNTSLMRCLAKNFSMASGVALTTYAGEEYYQSEIGDELDAIKEEITEVATELMKEHNSLKEAQAIIGKAKVQGIKTVEEAQTKLEKLNKLLDKLKKEKANKKTTKKEEK